MIDRNEVRRTLEDYMQNPCWAAYYRDAPTDRCREFIALEFYYSEYEDDEAGEEMDRIEAELDIAGLRHLFKYCGNDPRKGVLARRIAEKEKAGETR